MKYEQKRPEFIPNSSGSKSNSPTWNAFFQEKEPPPSPFRPSSQNLHISVNFFPASRCVENPPSPSKEALSKSFEEPASLPEESPIHAIKNTRKALISEVKKECSHEEKKIVKPSHMQPIPMRPPHPLPEKNDSPERRVIDLSHPEEINVDEMSYEQLLELEELMGKVSKGLTPEQIEVAFWFYRDSIGHCYSSLRTKSRPREANVSVALLMANSCSVCQYEVATGETVKILPCDHIFHSDCITPWFGQQKTCPICGAHVIPAWISGCN